MFKCVERICDFGKTTGNTMEITVINLKKILSCLTSTDGESVGTKWIKQDWTATWLRNAWRVYPRAVKSDIFWDITLYSPVKSNWCFGGKFRLRPPGRRVSQAASKPCSSETIFYLYWPMRRDIPEYRTLPNPPWEPQPLNNPEVTRYIQWPKRQYNWIWGSNSDDWDMTPCRLKIYWCLGGKRFLHLQTRRVS